MIIFFGQFHSRPRAATGYGVDVVEGGLTGEDWREGRGEGGGVVGRGGRGLMAGEAGREGGGWGGGGPVGCF